MVDPTCDPGCSENGNYYQGYGLGDCPIRREPCPRACLLRTIRNMKTSLDSEGLRMDATRAVARREGMEEAARITRARGSRSLARAIEDQAKQPGSK